MEGGEGEWDGAEDGAEGAYAGAVGDEEGEGEGPGEEGEGAEGAVVGDAGVGWLGGVVVGGDRRTHCGDFETGNSAPQREAWTGIEREDLIGVELRREGMPHSMNSGKRKELLYLNVWRINNKQQATGNKMNRVPQHELHPLHFHSIPSWLHTSRLLDCLPVQCESV